MKKTAKKVNVIADQINYLSTSRSKVNESLYNVEIRGNKMKNSIGLDTTENGTPDFELSGQEIKYEEEDEELNLSDFL